METFVCRYIQGRLDPSILPFAIRTIINHGFILPIPNMCGWDALRAASQLPSTPFLSRPGGSFQAKKKGLGSQDHTIGLKCIGINLVMLNLGG